MAEITVRDDADAHRFEALVDGEVAGFTEYHLQGDVQVMPHTVTAPELRGQGVAGAVVKAALEAARVTRPALRMVLICAGVLSSRRGPNIRCRWP